jgi:hypothetical protein
VTYTHKTDEEIKQLALDINRGLVWGSWTLKPTQDPKFAFMPLMFLTDEQIGELEKDDIVHFYEYIEKAGPRSVNGLPCFMSMNCLDRVDARKVYRVLRALAEAEKQTLEKF